jgi:mono/diheme cytochrome c family protein
MLPGPGDLDESRRSRRHRRTPRTRHGAHSGPKALERESKQFLSNASDEQIHALIAGGVSGTEMSPWGLDYGGTMTDEQVRQLVTYLRSLEHRAPSIPDWRTGATAP